jgi:aerobic-type carbon monoxide dehydrogenase small subunit (CoxS/CutS family)
MIALNVNGRQVRVDVDPATPLLWALRDHVGLTGTKYGAASPNAAPAPCISMASPSARAR